MNADIWFFGTGNFAARCLEKISAVYPPALVVTMPPARGGRGMKTLTVPVEEAALKLNLPLIRSSSVNNDEKLLALFHEKTPDLIFVVDFGQKIGEPWLTGPKRGCLNIHPSLLPLYRGAAPVQRAIMDGAGKTGVTLFRLVEKMDAGPVWYQAESPIGPEENTSELLERMADLGSSLFIRHAAAILNGTAVLAEQDETKATSAPKIEKAEARLNPDLPALVLHHLVCGLSPVPGAYFMFRGKRIKVLKTRLSKASALKGSLKAVKGAVYLGTQEGSLELTSVQPEGKKAMPASEWVRGLKLRDNEMIDPQPLTV